MWNSHYKGFDLVTAAHPLDGLYRWEPVSRQWHQVETPAAMTFDGRGMFKSAVASPSGSSGGGDGTGGFLGAAAAPAPAPAPARARAPAPAAPSCMERDSAYLKRLERQRRENQARRAALEAATLEKDAQYFAEREGAAAYRRQQRSESVEFRQHRYQEEMETGRAAQAAAGRQRHESVVQRNQDRLAAQQAERDAAAQQQAYEEGLRYHARAGEHNLDATLEHASRSRRRSLAAAATTDSPKAAATFKVSLRQ
eukprot:g3.t1